MVGQAGPPVLRANFESVPSRTLQGLIKPSHSPGIWTDLSVPQVEERANHLASFNSHSRTRTPSLTHPPVQSMSVYLGWQAQLRPHPKLRSIFSPNFHHPLFYLGALADETPPGVEPGNAWCGKRSESGSPFWWYPQTAGGWCFQMPSSGAGSLISSMFP